MSYTVISKISYEILFMFLLKLNKYIHYAQLIPFDISFIIYAYILYRSS